MNKLKLALGSDHAGFALKEKVKSHLINKGYNPEDFGCFSEERADYPDFGHAVAKSIENKSAQLGILVCGSGNGINMAANKHKDIRAALCWTPELAELSRQHNDANILSLPARFINEDDAIKCVEAFLSAEFEGGRHADRVKKINNI